MSRCLCVLFYLFSVPSAVRNINVSPNGMTDSLKVSWTPGGGDVDSYTVTIFQQNHQLDSRSVSKDVSEHTFHDLEAGEQYRVVVQSNSGALHNSLAAFGRTSKFLLRQGANSIILSRKLPGCDSINAIENCYMNSFTWVNVCGIQIHSPSVSLYEDRNFISTWSSACIHPVHASARLTANTVCQLWSRLLRPYGAPKYCLSGHKSSGTICFESTFSVMYQNVCCGLNFCAALASSRFLFCATILNLFTTSLFFSSSSYIFLVHFG